MSRSAFIVLVGVLVTGSFTTIAEAAKCTYGIKEKSHALEWTAYKTTGKIPVSGSFKTIEFTQKGNQASIDDVIRSITFHVHSLTLDTGAPPRDKTLLDNFIIPMANAASIKGVIKSHDPEKKETVASITMNGVTKDVTFAFERKDQALIWTATIDYLKDFAMKASYQKLSEACKTLHTGHDGKSMTWTEVALKVTASVYDYCP